MKKYYVEDEDGAGYGSLDFFDAIVCQCELGTGENIRILNFNQCIIRMEVSGSA